MAFFTGELYDAVCAKRVHRWPYRRATVGAVFAEATFSTDTKNDEVAYIRQLLAEATDAGHGANHECYAVDLFASVDDIATAPDQAQSKAGRLFFQFSDLKMRLGLALHVSDW